MNELKIQDNFFQYVKEGIKNFEIRKKDYGFKDWTKVRLLNIETQETLIVKLKQTKMNTFEIGQYLSELLRTKGNESDFWEYPKRQMLSDVNNFVLEDYFKQGDSLYWYDLELVNE
ncbi:hypothetical protein ELUMI_v1c05280 [Williamsoniiplasma luminosum]|uniref:DUF3850 domain-containing protein n=1 Tax=Williamsoniiplasma luminosum TaxID=214888 RepID=A0A2K8NTT3_9MOLU|nr:DUF3850 domain-containing protein [Williamsoniiplasma luminosum]ATZ17252.1 hypothetical protein ELUMI_v1c05280 [Williamsoniiplasma luminosum]